MLRYLDSPGWCAIAGFCLLLGGGALIAIFAERVLKFIDDRKISHTRVD